MPTWNVTFEPRIDLKSSNLIRSIIQIEAYKVSVLKIPVPPLLKQHLNELNIIRQIRGTTGIEGNSLNEEQIKRAIEKTQPEGREEKEAKNAENVRKFIIQWNKRYPGGIVTEQFIRKLHEISTIGIEYEDNVPGQYRQVPVHAGDYLPPSSHLIRELMETFIGFINQRELTEGYGPIIRAILAHFYLISIHPFRDGNGRTSRALEAFILYSGGYNIYGFYSLANYFYKKRNLYIEQLDNARFRYNGCLQNFVEFALQGFIEELNDVQDEILAFVRLAMYKDYLNECYQLSKISSRCEAIAHFLLDTEPHGISEIDWKSRRHSLSREFYKDIKTTRTIERDLKNLEKAYLIKIENGKIRPNLNFLTALDKE